MKGIVKSPGNSTLLAAFSIFLATMSLGAAFYQNYIYTRLLDSVQRNVTRAEYIRSCRDVIDAYFQVKLKVGLLSRLTERTRPGDAEAVLETEAAQAVSRFGAIGTYLANFQNEDTRYQYTQLTLTLEKLLPLARNTAPGDLALLFEPADRLFANMNEDCVRSARTAPL